MFLPPFCFLLLITNPMSFLTLLRDDGDGVTPPPAVHITVPLLKAHQQQEEDEEGEEEKEEEEEEGDVVSQIL